MLFSQTEETQTKRRWKIELPPLQLQSHEPGPVGVIKLYKSDALDGVSMVQPFNLFHIQGLMPSLASGPWPL